jgi:DNA mismatch repair protein MutL
LHILLDVQPTLDRLGFRLELFGGTTVVVHAIPAATIDRWHDGALLREMLSLYGDLPSGPPIEERVARAWACRAAVKAGEPLTPVAMNELLDRLFATTLPQGDPHGRPTFLKVPIEDLHRRFGRSG